jgi:hypothetical protein
MIKLITYNSPKGFDIVVMLEITLRGEIVLCLLILKRYLEAQMRK